MRKDIKYKAILFDLFGTLVYHCPQEDFNFLMSNMSKELGLDLKTFIDLWMETSTERAIGKITVSENILIIANKQNIFPSKKTTAKITEIRKNFFKTRLTPRKETIETLTAIKAKGYKIGLISDCSFDIPSLFKETTMYKYFDTLIFSCEANTKKPHKEIYLRALQNLNISNDQALFIGDGGSNELTGAKNVGIDAIKLNDPLIPNSFRYDAQTNWHGPTINNLSEIIDLI